MFGQIGRRERLERNIKGGGLMVKVLNGGLPIMVKFVVIFTVKVIGMFFNFDGFPNETGGIMMG
jgi:hypothetical protein